MPIQHDYSLQTLNTLGINHRAKAFLRLTTLDDLPLLEAWRDQPRLILGEGSNLLFCEDFAGLVIQNALKGIEIETTDDGWHVHAAAGENWHALVTHLLENGIPGLENLALIPGTVGAAPVQNIGAYGVELADFCHYVEAVELETGQLHRLAAAQCRFGYRDSIFKREHGDTHLITAVGLFLPRSWQPRLTYRPLAAQFDGQEATPRAIYEAVCAIRQSKLPDPALLGNAGSFFKNPVIRRSHWQALRESHPELPGWAVEEKDAIKIPAGWLIDRAGLKGHRLGQAGVHQDQALVLVNHGGARANEVIDLAAQVRSRINQLYGILLEPEVRFIAAHGETSLQHLLEAD